MKFGKFVSILIVLSVLLTVVVPAFAQDPTPKPLPWLKRWDGTELTLSSHTGPTTDAYKKLAKEFEALTGAKVTVIDESWTDLLGKHLAASAAKTGAYDILTWPYIWTGQYVEGDMVENLNDWLAKKDLVDPNYDLADFVPAILEVYGRYKTGFFKDPDALWSVPYKFDIYLAQYRKDLFKEAGLVDEKGEAKPPETWDELLAALKKIAEKHPEMKPVAFPLAVDDPMVSTFLPIFASYGGTFPTRGSMPTCIRSSRKKPGVKAAEALKALLPYMPKDVLSMDYDMINAYMAQGLGAYALNWNAYLPVLLDKSQSKIADEVAFDLAPGGPERTPAGPGWLADGYLQGLQEQGSRLPVAAVPDRQGTRSGAGAGRRLGRPHLDPAGSRGGQGLPVLSVPAEGHGQSGAARHGPLVAGSPAHHRRGPEQGPDGRGHAEDADRHRPRGLQAGADRRIHPGQDRPDALICFTEVTLATP